MPKICSSCRRIRGKNHLCDVALLTNGHVVHAKRIAIGGDLRESLGDDVKVVGHLITPEMKAQEERGEVSYE